MPKTVSWWKSNPRSGQQVLRAFRWPTTFSEHRTRQAAPRSPNLNPYAERFVLSVKSESLDNLILFGEKSLTYVLNEYITHYHLERNHQGNGNTLISPRPDSDKDRERDIKCQERLGGLLKFYHRPAA